MVNSYKYLNLLQWFDASLNALCARPVS